MAVAAIVVALGTAAPAQADITLTSWKLSPTCVNPGGTVNSTVTIYSNANPFSTWDRLYVQFAVREAVTGLVVRQRNLVSGWYVPPGILLGPITYGERIPWYTPPGFYKVNLRLGSSQGGSQWASDTRTFKVWYWC